MQRSTKLAKYSKVIANRLKTYSDLNKFIEVRTAFELNDEQKERIKNALKAKYGYERHIRFVVDHELIGGVLLKINLEIIDSSLKTKLDQIINTKEKEGA